MQANSTLRSVLASLLLTLSPASFAQANQVYGPMLVASGAPVAATSPRRIQVAILLDTSSSMDGLINQARTRLWAMVGALAQAKRGNSDVRVELALYEYGNSTLAENKGYIRQISGFSSDLDEIAERLFALRTNGGDEYAGWVIKDALANLRWSSEASDVRMVFIAGNEGFDQGPVAFQEALSAAKRKGVVVNTIYCGDGENQEARLWENAAKSSQGSFAAINQNEAVQEIASPYDAEIAALSNKLNDTYIAYGQAGGKAKAKQVAQDRLAAEAGVGASRAKAKASKAYSNESWDLVDAAKASPSAVAAAPAESLPEEMQRMSKDERSKYVETKAKERVELQRKIDDLSKKRDAHVAQERMKAPAKTTLDEKMLGGIRKEAEAKGYKF